MGIDFSVFAESIQELIASFLSPLGKIISAADKS